MKLTAKIMMALTLVCLIFSLVSCSMQEIQDLGNDGSLSAGGTNNDNSSGSLGDGDKNMSADEGLSGGDYSDDYAAAPEDSAPGGDGYYGGADKDSSYAPSMPEGDDSTEGETEGGSADTDAPTEDKPEDIPEQIIRPAGLITAKAWNDNDDYDYWLKNFTEGGKFHYTQVQGGWGFELSRLKVNVTDGGGNAIVGAKVAFSYENDPVVYAVTDSAGVAYIFTSRNTGTLSVTSGSSQVTRDVIANIVEYDVLLETDVEKKQVIELMFVIDVTGSMGDELEYLQNEISDVIERVSKANSGVRIDLAILFYRDSNDSEKFAYHDFVTVTDASGMDIQLKALMNQMASGGGDYPEAVDEALDLAVNKQWSGDATTKIIFQILDAPPHSKASNKTVFSEAVKAAAAKGIRICPILCSGADTLTEFVMRQAAVQTGGTSVFVTDDSGIGGSHLDPSLPNSVVEALNSLMIRLINGYYTGTFEPPVSWKTEIQER